MQYLYDFVCIVMLLWIQQVVSFLFSGRIGAFRLPQERLDRGVLPDVIMPTSNMPVCLPGSLWLQQRAIHELKIPSPNIGDWQAQKKTQWEFSVLSAMSYTTGKFSSHMISYVYDCMISLFIGSCFLPTYSESDMFLGFGDPKVEQCRPNYPKSRWLCRSLQGEVNFCLWGDIMIQLRLTK